MSLSSRHLSCLSLLLLSGTFAYSALRAAQGPPLGIAASAKDGSYSISAPGISKPVLHASAAAKIDGKWLRAADYPQHIVTKGNAQGDPTLGAAEETTIRYTGRPYAPELVLHLLAHTATPFGEANLTVINTTAHPVDIQALRVIDATGEEVLHLGGPASRDRVLSDSFSEDRPALQIRDLIHAENNLHRGVGSQLIYNQQSNKSWFIGALTSDKFLSVLRLHMTGGDGSAKTASYEVDSTGTTELLEENSLQDSPAPDHVELSLPLAPGAELSSERMLFSIADDYHQQLETYAHLIRTLHQARVSAPTPLGWWSWTAYYFGLNENTALTNAEWLSQHLKPLGYDFFHMDEGYQFARGEYASPDATLFPSGVAALERKVMNEGLVPGIWTAPFEVSERSWIYATHPDWLVHNAQGAPIHLGRVTDNTDRLYAIDTTNPGAQNYLHSTYSTLVNQWGIRYIKLDFMEDSAVEGFYFRPHTTALEAQRIGLKVIRDAVGPKVLLDKDGCELLNPVGIVDAGRISQDTGHTFSASKDAAPGMAARYYMNRNYFLADPDAFSVSQQTVDDQHWHGGTAPLTLGEAKASIALSAVTGGLFEIGDDLPSLGESPDRVALVENRDLIDMARLGRASTPLDLMNYEAEDLQPSIFLLKENQRQTILTVFNWTEKSRAHHFDIAALGLAPGSYTIADVLDATDHPRSITTALDVTLPAHSAQVLKIINTQIPSHPPSAKAAFPSAGKAGEAITFTAEPATDADAIIHYSWELGDGVKLEGRSVTHAYTHEGDFQVKLIATGLDGVEGESASPIKITGSVSTRYYPEKKRRLTGATQ
jgi:alpha-galactosidase